MRDLRLIFLTRVGCHLCDDARPLVLAEAGRIGATVDEIDIDTDDELTALYGMRIPVIIGPADQLIAEGIINDKKGLRKALKGL